MHRFKSVWYNEANENWQIHRMSTFWDNMKNDINTRFWLTFEIQMYIHMFYISKKHIRPHRGWDLTDTRVYCWSPYVNRFTTRCIFLLLVCKRCCCLVAIFREKALFFRELNNSYKNYHYSIENLLFATLQHLVKRL